MFPLLDTLISENFAVFCSLNILIIIICIYARCGQACGSYARHTLLQGHSRRLVIILLIALFPAKLMNLLTIMQNMVKTLIQSQTNTSGMSEKAQVNPSGIIPL